MDKLVYHILLEQMWECHLDCSNQCQSLDLFFWNAELKVPILFYQFKGRAYLRLESTLRKLSHSADKGSWRYPFGPLHQDDSEISST